MAPANGYATEIAKPLAAVVARFLTAFNEDWHSTNIALVPVAANSGSVGQKVAVCRLVWLHLKHAQKAYHA